MKKLFTLAMLLFPILAIAQNGDLVSFEQFVAKFSDTMGYKTVSLDKHVLKQLEDSGDNDIGTKKLLSKLKAIQILEFKPKRASETAEEGGTTKAAGKSVVSVASSIVGVSSRGKNQNRPRGGNIVYVDGIRIRSDMNRLGMKANSQIDLTNFKPIVEENQNSYTKIYRKKSFLSSKSEYILLTSNKIVKLTGKFDFKSKKEIETFLENVNLKLQPQVEKLSKELH